MTEELNILEYEELKVPGLFYIDDIKEDTDNIIPELDKLAWIPLTNSPNSRLVQHYGYKYNYTTYKINEKCEDIPDIILNLKNILTEICLQLNIIDSKYEFNQCIVNNYTKNQGISPHIDIVSYGKVIGCFTIGTDATMTFVDKNEKIDLYVKSNSLYIMSGDARYKWKHSMTSKAIDIVNGEKISRNRRVSITFRNVPC